MKMGEGNLDEQGAVRQSVSYRRMGFSNQREHLR